MRRARVGLGLLAGASVVVVSGGARAQIVDVNPPLPNVMILLDTSGSMEKMIDGTNPEDKPGNACTVTTSVMGATSVANRWGTATQALTGQIVDATGAPTFRCAAMSRASTPAITPFVAEFGIAPGPATPYDADYYLPFHRLASGSCVNTPGLLPATADLNPYPLTALSTKDYITNAVGCTFRQAPDGAIDTNRAMMRFGLMTFDPLKESGTGAIGTAGTMTTNTASPFVGTFSYFPGWNTGSPTPAKGGPHDCATFTDFEVGARNMAAPPWEGRLVPFPAPNALTAAVGANNDRVKGVVNASRPFGATPIAGMFEDAVQYFWDDTNGPQKTDPYVNQAVSCRDQYIILITDGSPNMDLRPWCAMAPTDPLKQGQCPYPVAQNIVSDLYAGSHTRAANVSNPGTSSGKKVTTFVVGFAVSDDTGAPVNCTDVVSGPLFDPGGTFCGSSASAANLKKYAPCCTLEQLALSGSGNTQGAFFVATPGDLNTALATITANIAKKTTTRTVPAYSPVSVDSTNASQSASLYLSSFQPTPGRPWSGDVTRQRYLCDSSYSLATPAITLTAGDDFAANLNSHVLTNYTARQFSVIEPALVGTARYPTNTIRPSITGTPADGLTAYSAAVNAPAVAATAITSLSATSLGIPSPNTSLCPNDLNSAYMTPSACKELALNFAMGSQNTTLTPGFSFKSRYDNAFGDIFHASPTVVGPPNALIRDESYQAWRSSTSWGSSNPQNIAGRPTVLYATNDGLLHAFDTAVSAKENNEIWALIPPAVLPNIIPTYPAGHALLLDGSPVVKDTVWDRAAADIAAASTASGWHSTLVAGLGTAGRGYYAVDVSSPGRTDVTLTSGGPKPLAGAGPTFLWQLTSVAPLTSNEVFGARSATPAIATVFIGTTPHEVGVAILPGGSNGGPIDATSKCDRHGPTTFGAGAGATAMPDTGLPLESASAYPARDKVPCYAASSGPVPGRSLTIVRLDTGEILRTFSPTEDRNADINAKGRWTYAPLDSPMTGIPVVYPATVGAIAQKIFIADQDGTVWRFDLQSTDPANWTGQLFFDTNNSVVDASTSAWKNGQPITLPPVVALDRTGNLVVEVATGDQDTYTTTGTNYIWSLTEQLSATDGKLRPIVNWWHTLTGGERVSGPMAVFDGVLYYSTFTAGGGAAVCTAGTPKIYGRDFVVPRQDTGTVTLGGGGEWRFNPIIPPAIIPAATIPEFYSPAVAAGKIIPGVSINLTPTCANTSVGVPDPYTGQTHYGASSVSPGEPRLVVQYGASGGSSTGAPGKIETKLPAPKTVTIVDSWASVVE